MILNPYLVFNGNCEEAFDFYKQVFKKDFSYLGRFKDVPDGPHIDDKFKDKIMHVSLPLSQETVLMGSDAYEPAGDHRSFGTNVTLSVSFKDIEEATRVFNELAEGGSVRMPLEKTFWADLFGELTDKYGILWMVMAYSE
jgi:PhnB protein